MSFRQELDDLSERLEGAERYRDVCFMLTRDKDASTILFAGGQWDSLERDFTDRDPEKVVKVAIEESQVEFATWFASYLRDFRDGHQRDISFVLSAGARRGGKTFVTYLCQIAALIDVPFSPIDQLPTIGWTISRTFRQRDELDQIVSGYFPQRMYRHQRAPEHRFTFPHGSYLRTLSADDPDSLKSGRVDFLLYNEGQLMSPTAVKNGMYGTADRGGLTIMAANPPSGPNGEWLRDWKEAIDEDPEIRPITKYFFFDAKQNTKVDQPARRRVAKIAQRLDPEMGDADAEGSWTPWGKYAYPAWSKSLIAPMPQIGAFQDLTTAVTKREFFSDYHHVIGGDFQRRPQAAAILKVLKIAGVEGDVYQFVDECGVKGTEVDLSTELYGFPHSYTPQRGSEKSAMWIGDCSGSYQGAERIKGRTSYTLLEGEGWAVFPAEIIKLDGKSDHPKNPDVAQRLGLLERLMRAGRIRVAPECVWLARAFKKCELRTTDTGRRVPKGQYAHITDAASYAIWRLEPKPGKAPTLPTKGSFGIASIPRGPRIL